jgi:hypothetical protein
MRARGECVKEVRAQRAHARAMPPPHPAASARPFAQRPSCPPFFPRPFTVHAWQRRRLPTTYRRARLRRRAAH